MTIQPRRRPLPEPDDGVRGWVVRYASKNLWRLGPWMELEDLIQDGEMIWYKVCRHYPHIDHMPHLMGLFKSSYANHITDLSNKRGPENCEADLSDGSAGFWENILGAVRDDMPEFAALFAKAPGEVKEVLMLLASDVGLRALREPGRRSKKHRETTNELLCRLTGKDPTTTDLAGTVRNFLTAT